MKKIAVLALFIVFIIFQARGVTSNFTTFSDGNVLTASQLNNLQTHYTNADNAILDGDTYTGDNSHHSGSDIKMFSDLGTTLKIHLFGDSGKIIGANHSIGEISNVNLVRVTSVGTNDTLRLQCGGATCSATNPGLVVSADGTTPGKPVIYTVTSDIDITLTGAHFEQGGNGDLPNGVLRVLLVNDLTLLKMCVAWVGGRTRLTPGDTTATGTSAILAENLLCNNAIVNTSNTALEIGYVKANFDDSDSDTWHISGNSDSVITGTNADGIWQHWNPTYSGFSADPSGGDARFTQVGSVITVNLRQNAGTSNTSAFTFTLPIDVAKRVVSEAFTASDNSTPLFNTSPQLDTKADGTNTATMFTDSNSGSWTASGSKSAVGTFSYEVSGN